MHDSFSPYMHLFFFAFIPGKDGYRSTSTFTEPQLNMKYKQTIFEHCLSSVTSTFPSNHALFAYSVWRQEETNPRWSSSPVGQWVPPRWFNTTVGLSPRLLTHLPGKDLSCQHELSLTSSGSACFCREAVYFTVCLSKDLRGRQHEVCSNHPTLASNVRGIFPQGLPV